MRKRHVLHLSVVLVFCGSGLGGTPHALATDPSHVGQWSPVLDWPLQTIHMVMLHTDKVLCTDGPSFLLFEPSDDPVKPGTWTTIDGPTGHNLFCSGHSAFPDGRILFNGGGFSHYQKTTIYDPDAGQTGSWDYLGEISPANRFYPTLTTLADGTILAMGGHHLTANTPAIFDPASPGGSQWVKLPCAEYCSSAGCGPQNCDDPMQIEPYDFHIHFYPFMFQLSSGRVLYTGEHQEETPGDAIRSRTLLAVPGSDEDWADLVSPATDDPIKGDSAVMYAPDKVIKGGGYINGVATDEVYKLDASSTTGWEAIDAFTEPRAGFHLIALPDGSILAVGGEVNTVPVLEPELLKDPADAWEVMAPLDQANPREYHSAAVLLPNARILIAGGEEAPDIHHKTAQIFSPPYLYAPGGGAASRPAISSVSTDFGGQTGVKNDVIRYGNTFTVGTGNGQAGGITNVSLIRLGSVTHNFDFDQRFVGLGPPTQPDPNVDELSVTAPSTPQEAPGGYYMLFILDDGVPSVSQIINLCGYSSADCNGNGVADDCDLAAGISQDCNGNTIPDLCDITAGTSQDCNSTLIPDECEGGPFPALLVASTPAHDESLWRSEKNIARLTFACDVQAPATGEVLVQKLLANGAFGPDLSGSFSFTLENPGAGDRVLRIFETTTVLTHREWYAIRNTGSWSGAAPFELHYVVQVGDASNDDQEVTSFDVSVINAAIPCLSGCGDARREDIDGNEKILSFDVSITNAHIPSFTVPKPSGH